MLKKLDVAPTIVGDGAAALQAASERHYDLILMDVMMPNMNGIVATGRIRSSDGPCRDIPIIAFTAAAFDSDREKALEAGMTDFIEKPARLETLRTVLRRHLPRDGEPD
jgi:CheY-like chemotaxis protein